MRKNIQFVAFATIWVLFTFSANAQFDVTVTSTPAEPIQSETVDLIFSATGVTDLFYYGLEIDFDETAFELVGVDIEESDFFNSSSLATAGTLGAGLVGASSVRTNGTAGGNGELFRVRFNVLATASDGEYTFSFTESDARDGNGDTITSTVDDDIEIILGEPPVRDVTFSVDMTIPIETGLFTPGTDLLEVRGNFNDNDWSPGLVLSTEGDDLYTITIEVLAPENETLDYKYFIVGEGYEDFGGNRNFTTGPVETDQDLPLDVFGVLDPTIGFANLQFPENATINQGSEFDIFAQIFSAGITDALTSAYPYINAWIGINSTDSNPDSWDESVWEVSSFNTIVDNNGDQRHEYQLTTGSSLSPGTYYYASRFQLLDGSFVYGGTGGFWDNDSGELTVQGGRDVTFSVDMNVQFQYGNFDPEEDTIDLRGGFSGWESVALTETDTGTMIYETTITLFGDSGSNFEYKFYLNSTPEGSVGPGDNGNRVIELGAVGTPVTLPTVLFSNFDYPDPAITYANLQFPNNETILLGQDLNVFGRVLVDGITGSSLPPPGIELISAWVGFSDTDASSTSDFESGWTWVEADLQAYDGDFGDNSEYVANIGAEIEDPGTYFFVTRFQFEVPGEGVQDFVYGGFPNSFWDGTDHVSGQVVVEESVIVWPGDTNNDGTVDQDDALAIGTYFGQTGPERIDASLSWSGQVAEPWDPVAATYADTDGSGRVDQTDLLAVGLNFGETVPGTLLDTSPPVFTDNLPGIGRGQYIQLRISPRNPIDIQGMAFNIELSGVEEDEFSYRDKILGEWSQEWLEANRMIRFNREEETSLYGAFAHMGLTTPKTADSFFEIEIHPEEMYLSNANLLIHRITIVDENGDQIRLSAEDLNFDMVVLGESEVPELPRTTALMPNYPNPFNPTTNIVFNVSETITATIDVVNVLGQRVAILTQNEEFAPGTYTRIFDATNLSSGTYIVRMYTGERLYNRKIMLIK